MQSLGKARGARPFKGPLIKPRSITRTCTYPEAKFREGTLISRDRLGSIGRLSRDYSNYRADLASFAKETADI